MIDLRKPVRQERVRGFQPPWRTVFVYVCPDCKKEVRVNASKFHGKTPVPEIGAITCPHCPSVAYGLLLLSILKESL